jgi:hypothetical protein
MRFCLKLSLLAGDVGHVCLRIVATRTQTLTISCFEIGPLLKFEAYFDVVILKCSGSDAAGYTQSL